MNQKEKEKYIKEIRMLLKYGTDDETIIGLINLLSEIFECRF